jgi:hypothetical protein
LKTLVPSRIARNRQLISIFCSLMRTLCFILENLRFLQTHQKWIRSLPELVLFPLYHWLFNLGLALISCKHCFPSP